MLRRTARVNNQTNPAPEITRHKPLKQWISWFDGTGGAWTYLLVVTATGTNGFEYGQTKMLGYESVRYLVMLDKAWRELEAELENAMRNDNAWE